MRASTNQRISTANLERFLAARILYPSLTFDEWVTRLWAKATSTPFDSTADMPPKRGRPRGTVRETGVTGGSMRPLLFRLLLAAPGHRLPRGEVIERLEGLLADRIEESDREITSAGIPRWRHALLGDIAILRRRGLLLPDSKERPRVWQLSDAGGRAADRLLKLRRHL